MGSNSTEAAGIALFLAGFTVLAAGFARGNVLCYVAAAALIAGSFALLRSGKSLEAAG